MKKLSIILGISLLLFLSSMRALAQGNDPPIPPVPTDGSVVLDTLDWLDSIQESRINTINRQLDEDGIAQIAVVTLDNCGEDPQRFRNELFRTWGIGHADDNDGLLILVCWYGGDESLRTLEQETGFGLEGVLPDILTSRVARDYFVPAFQEDRPGEGLLAMVQQYDSILREDGETLPEPIPVSNVDSGLGWLITGVLGLLPGYVLAKAYTLMAYPRAPRMGTNPWDEAQLGRPNVRRNQFVIAQAISLIPILGVLFVIQQLTALLPTVQEYAQFILPKLALWLVFLLIILINSSNYRRGGWHSGDGGYWGSGTGGYGGFPDSGSDVGGFGGGDSGGGGSSTKF